ncbi:MAG: hypothetical protein QMD23_07285 [Candidatus Bathyarchaeia archaeon]|nr:hypothetical protein [Candidatus Bathyarchaeia archaeon]
MENRSPRRIPPTPLSKKHRKSMGNREKIQNPVHDHFIIMLTSPNKTIGIIEISWLAKKEEEIFEFIDSKGRKIEILNYNFFSEYPEKPEKNTLQGYYRDQKQIMKKWAKFFLTNIRNRRLTNCVPQYILLNKFIEAIKKRHRPANNTRKGRKTVRLLEYIEESLNKNEPIIVGHDLS